MNVLWRVVAFLYGFDRLKHRGDCLFLSGDFQRALVQYRRARSLLRDADERALSLDAIIGECEGRDGVSHPRATEALVEGVAPVGAGGTIPPDEVERPFLLNLDELFELAIADKPASRAEAYRVLGDDFKRGYVALVQGDGDTAARALERAAARTGPSFVLQLELGRAYSLAGRLVAAGDALEEAERLSPADVEGALLLGAVNVELGRFREAREKLESLLRMGERTPEVLYLLGKSLAGLGRRDEALERFRETVRMEPRFHEAYFEGARIVADGGDAEAALSLLHRACSLEPDEVRYNRALVRLVLDHDLDAETGLPACDRLMVTDVDRHWEYLSWIAELYIRRGWKREARDPLRKALALVPRELSSERLSIEQKLTSLGP